MAARAVCCGQMKSARAQRAFLIGLAAALATGWLCAVVLWSEAFGSSGESSLLTVTSAMVALVIALQAPRAIIRVWRRFSRRSGMEDLLTAPVTSAPAGPDVNAMKKLLALAAAVAGLSIPAGLAMIPVGVAGANALNDSFLWSGAGAAVASVAMRVLCLLPMAALAAVALLVLALVRGGWGRDTYATTFSDLLLGLAAALAIFAVAWCMGLNLLGLAMAMAVLLLGAGAGMLAARSPLRASHTGEIAGPTGRITRLAVWPAFAAGALALAVQQRMLADILGAGQPVMLAFLAASLAATAAMLKVHDRKPHAIDAAEMPAAAVGLVCGLLMQAALVLHCVWQGRACQIYTGIAAAMQLPLAALAATILSRQRRTFAEAGGRARAYFGRVLGGAAAGLLLYVAMGHAGRGLLVLLAAALGAITLAIIAAIGRKSGWRQQLRWAVFGAAVLCASTAGIVTSAQNAVRQFGSLAAGVWLTAASLPESDSMTYLPMPPRPANPGITKLLEKTLAACPRGGVWWAGGVAADLPAIDGMVLEMVAPDASAVLGPWPGGKGFVAHAPGRRQYDGAILALLPADHGQAWRCYNAAELGRVVRRVHPGGPVLLRTQCASRHAGAALAVAETFLQQVGSGWAAVAFDGDEVDMLLGGPSARLPMPRAKDVDVLPLEVLLSGDAAAVPLTLGNAGGACRRPRNFDLRRHVEAMVSLD